MRFLILSLSLVSSLALAANPEPAKMDNLKDSARVPWKKDFAGGKADLMAALEYRKKMEAKVYLSRKKILETSVECVKKAKDLEAIAKCDRAERQQALDSVKEMQTLLNEFGAKMKTARASLGLPEPMSPQDAAMQSAMSKGQEAVKPK